MTRLTSTLTAPLVIALALAGATPALAGAPRPIGTVTIDGVGSFPVFSFACGVRQASTPTASSTGNIAGQRAEFSGLSVMKAMDLSSPKLFFASASGTVFPKAQLDLFGARQEVVASIMLTNVLIAGVNQGGTATADAPAEEINLSFTKIELKYRGPNGDSAAGWDLSVNKAV